ncbi:hypothetical protein KP79_PYT25154 [Mizuhopecten yessoensis]|uniref:Uncharacterized protein n=1 Tax=Mizuhopecten yessoensis TaxID=6573 RepID=A0A210PTU7_MIZYE|nr:hypothetical protein KP79_PYT25154 [Mizuhopecten yessoensis]
MNKKTLDSLVEFVRYWSTERAEMYRARLKTRGRGKNESLSEVAQSIRILSRQAYPTADANYTSILALDHLIDLLQDSEMRLRVREIPPKTINEAETHAIRLEAHRLADRHRGKSVHQVCQEEPRRVPVNQLQSIRWTTIRGYKLTTDRKDHDRNIQNCSQSHESI